MAISQQRRSENVTLWKALCDWLVHARLLLSMSSPLDSTGAHQAARAQRADIEKFEAFVHQYERQILNFLWRMTADEQAAYDLSQETFLRAWQQFAKISDYEQPRAWLFHVATNLAISHRRHQAGFAPAASLLDDDPSSSDPSGHFVESDLVHHILQELPPRRRAALILREVYGLTAEEVAQALGMTRDAVKMALSRAREQFRQAYAKETQS